MAPTLEAPKSPDFPSMDQRRIHSDAGLVREAAARGVIEHDEPMKAHGGLTSLPGRWMRLRAPPIHARSVDPGVSVMIRGWRGGSVLGTGISSHTGLCDFQVHLARAWRGFLKEPHGPLRSGWLGKRDETQASERFGNDNFANADGPPKKTSTRCGNEMKIRVVAQHHTTTNLDGIRYRHVGEGDFIPRH